MRGCALEVGLLDALDLGRAEQDVGLGARLDLRARSEERAGLVGLGSVRLERQQVPNETASTLGTE